MSARSTWLAPEHVERYRSAGTTLPHRDEGERVLVDFVPGPAKRIVDLGCGDGHLLALVLAERPSALGIAVDFSPPMLDAARERFADQERVTVVAHDLTRPLPDALGDACAVVSSFAIHHLEHDRKRELFAEVHALLRPGGVFLNLEHVASASDALHARFLSAIGYPPDWHDPANRLLDVESQLVALRAAGFTDVDCAWKWLEMGLLVARKPREGQTA